MRLNLKVTKRTGRSGIEVRSPQLKLTSHGQNDVEATESLRRGIVAWCSGLKSSNRLENALSARRVQWTPDGDSIVVEFMA